MSSYTHHYHKSIELSQSPEEIFDYADDHTRFSSHMSNSSWMMMGSKMNVSTDNKKGQEVGSHIFLDGSILGISMYIDEVVTEHQKPKIKAWKTVTVKNLMVVGDYMMKLEVLPQNGKSLFQVSIDYDMPKTNKWIGFLLGDWYAKWCVQQMLGGVKNHFNSNP